MHTTLVGEALYWLFLASWSLYGAYQIVVRRVHDRLAERLSLFLFGVAITPEHGAHDEHAGGDHAHEAHAVHVHTKTETTEVIEDIVDGDPFIISQIQRTK